MSGLGCVCEGARVWLGNLSGSSWCVIHNSLSRALGPPWALLACVVLCFALSSADGCACANAAVMIRAHGSSVLTSICVDGGALRCVVPATRAGRPAPTAHAKRFRFRLLYGWSTASCGARRSR